MENAVSDRSPLDHGYAWVITMANFLSNFLLVGYYRSFSVFFVDIADTFNTTYTLASLIMGVHGAVCSLASLLVHGVLLEVVGTRWMTLVGGLVFSAGIFLAYFAQSLPVLVFTLGALVGVGNACTFGPSIVLLGQYFDKRRALAASLASMGSSVGSMSMPALATELMLHYGLKGAFLLYGGLTLHLCVAAALYRPVPPTIITSCAVTSTDNQPNYQTSSSSGYQSSKNADDSASCAGVSCLDHESETTPLKRCSDKSQDSVIPGTDLSPPANKLQTDLSCRKSDSHINEHNPVLHINYEEGSCLNSKEMQYEVNPNVYNSSSRWLLPVPQTERLYVSAQDLVDIRSDRNHQTDKRHGTLPDLTFRSCTSHVAELNRSQSSMLSQVLQVVEKASVYASQPHLPTVSPLLTEVDHSISADDIKQENDNSDDIVNKKNRQSLCQKFVACLSCDGQMLRNPMFWLVQLYSGMGFMASQSAYSYLPSLLREKGLGTGHVALALTLLGACSLVGRLLIGVVVDRKIVSSVTAVSLDFLTLAALFFLVPALPNDLGMLLTFTVLYGLLEGVYFCLLPVIVIDLLGLRHFASAFGFIRLSQGAAATLLFPCLGQLRDDTGDYHATFCLIGACALLSGSLFVANSAFQTLKHCLSRHAK